MKRVASVTKPFHVDQLKAVVERVASHLKLKSEPACSEKK